jgi:hypothetical protein
MEKYLAGLNGFCGWRGAVESHGVCSKYNASSIQFRAIATTDAIQLHAMPLEVMSQQQPRQKPYK